MSQMGRPSRALVPTILLTLLPVGCSRRTPNLPGEAAAPTSTTPFQSQKTSSADTALQGQGIGVSGVFEKNRAGAGTGNAKSQAIVALNYYGAAGGERTSRLAQG